MACMRPPAGVCYSAIITLLFSIVYLLYLIVFCYYLMDGRLSNVTRICYVFIWHVLWSLLMWSFLTVALSNIKVPSSRYRLPIQFQERLRLIKDYTVHNQILTNFVNQNDLKIRSKIYQLQNGELIEAISFCTKCQIVQPDRCYHCVTCQHCILKLDHHCGLLGTCINFGNFKAFLLGIMYLFSIGMVIIVTIGPQLLSLLHEITYDTEHKTVIFITAVMVCVVLVIYVGIGSLSAGIGYGYMMYLTAKNRTVAEENEKGLPNYNLGNYWLNLKQVWGGNPLLWPFPIHTALGDGYIFPVFEEKEK